jgi:hypothetical protein
VLAGAGVTAVLIVVTDVTYVTPGGFLYQLHSNSSMSTRIVTTIVLWPVKTTTFQSRARGVQFQPDMLFLDIAG